LASKDPQNPMALESAEKMPGIAPGILLLAEKRLVGLCLLL